MNDAIAEAVAAAEGATLARWLLGTADPAAIRDRLERFVADHLDAGIAAVRFASLSVGAVFGLTLEDGRDVVVKVLRPDTEPHRAGAARRVHEAVAARGFPAPQPLLGPVTFGPSALAVVDALVPGGAVGDGHDPVIRRAGAAGLARLVQLAADVPGTQALTVAGPQVPEDLWPAPHNPLFDFRATAAGAEWIDDLARRARAAADPAGETVVVHTDWTVRNLRFAAGELHVAFDWDSIGRELEVRAVGTAAAMFPARDLASGMAPPTPEEVGAFVADYEAVRGRPFGVAARRAIGAGALLAMGYTARCEHALDTVGAHLAGSYRAMLADHGDAYLEV